MISVRMKHRARARALEFMFGLEFTGHPWREELPKFWTTFEAKPAVREYAEHLIAGVHERKIDIDTHIESALQNWSWERVGRVEKTILRIATYEILHEDNVPFKVAIDEAIELTKSYASDDSARFVNGVLDRIHRTLTDQNTSTA